jgi:formylglycine-generating enzyme required for sulfatase activity
MSNDIKLANLVDAFLADAAAPTGDLTEADAELREAIETLLPTIADLRRDGTIASQAAAVESCDDSIVPGYRILEVLGRGGMGVVYLAEQMALGRNVAIKLLPASSAQDEAAVQRFQRESRLIASLQHPNIVTTYDAGERAGRHYLVMEYVDGPDLERLLKETGPFEVDQAVQCIREAGVGLSYAHGKGIVHRDVKPSNLLFDRTHNVVKVADLGLARLTQGAGLMPNSRSSATGAQLVGTFDYMAPEQILDPQSADARSDVYSLGCTLYRLLTGEPVFARKNVLATILAHREEPSPPLKAARPDAPDWLCAVFARATAKRPEDRFQSVDELLAAIESQWVVSGQREITAISPPAQPSSRGRSIFAAVAVIAAIAIAAYVSLTKNHSTEEQQASSPQPAVEPIASVSAIPLEPVAATTVDGEHEAFVNTLGMGLVLVPAGSFSAPLRSAVGDNHASATVTTDQRAIQIARPFYLGIYPVKIEQFEQFVDASKYKTDAQQDGHGARPWPSSTEDELSAGFDWRRTGFPQTPTHPVVNISWNDATAFCKWLSKREGARYRLPTEAEWEYACRAGSSTRYYFGDQASQLSAFANFADVRYLQVAPGGARSPRGDDRHPFTSPVGSYRPNAWGLHDMLGNVWQWCSDRAADSSAVAEASSPSRQLPLGELRVRRGGAWNCTLDHCTCDARDGSLAQNQRSYDTGFRIVRDE